MKAGANRTDVNAIKRLADAGETAEFISGNLQIQQNVIESYMPTVEKEKPKPSKSKSKLAGYES